MKRYYLTLACLLLMIAISHAQAGFYYNYPFSTGRAFITDDEKKIITIGNQTDIQIMIADSLGILDTAYYVGVNDLQEIPYRIIRTADGNYVIAGRTYNMNNTNNSQVLLMKFDQFGDTLWSKNFGLEGRDEGYGVTETSDKGFVICGNRSGEHSLSGYIIKTDSAGNYLWDTTFNHGEFTHVFLYAIKESIDKDIYAMGINYTINGSPAQFIKLDPIGNIKKLKTIDIDTSYNIDEISSFVFGDDGYIYATGLLLNDSTRHAFVAKIDTAGNLCWKRVYEDPQQRSKIFSSIIYTSDDGLFVGGTVGYLSNQDNFCLLKADTAGNVVWENEYDRNGFNLLFEVLELSDGYAACGVSDTGCVLLKVNFDGNIHTNLFTLIDQRNIQVSIAPNPFNDYTNISINTNQAVTAFDLTIYDNMGRMVISSYIETSELFVFRKSSLAPGIYYYRIANDQVASSGKIIIQ
jgi:hypothetical protein